ncbi:SigE family RNA polymerase sigma factor [Cumulibacter manganitolerans]|uniref:SigE family RNA polymerase sigma factor n=1 Tax=Cumulibacter manganitolerans TaxID=1884992 RepID=UPI001E2E0B54|nr:SigE family RNA polymerase sigma factor [Cumulibacter manganitolerans]
MDVQALYADNWHQMVRLAYLLTGSADAAEDLVQDAFLALHRAEHRLHRPEAALAYVRRAILNRSRSAVRHTVVARKHLHALAGEKEGPPADTRLMREAEQSRLIEALRALPDRQREVLVLRYWSGLSEAEIAGALGISAGTVKSSTSRGMTALKEALGGAR